MHKENWIEKKKIIFLLKKHNQVMMIMVFTVIIKQVNMLCAWHVDIFSCVDPFLLLYWSYNYDICA